MKKPRIVKIKKDSSIPWYEQIEKTVHIPGNTGHQTFYAIKPSDYITILAQTTDNNIVIVRQFRPAIEDYTYELPSGHLEKNETPEDAAVRELKEETNCKAHDIVLMGKIYPDTGRLENRQWAFYSHNIEVYPFHDPAENEGIEVFLVKPEELFTMITEGKFRHALDLSVIALAMTRKYLKVT